MTDWDERRKEQEIQKAAELKAKLDMVKMASKPTYGRVPKKIGEIVCDTGLRTSYRSETARFVLRLDDKKGDFIAEHGDVWYVSKSREALQAKMDEVARVTLDIKWTRYLHVDYEAIVPCTYGGHSHIDTDESRKGYEGKIVGMQMTWEVVEFSDSIQLPGDDNDERFMKRDVDERGHVEEKMESVNHLPDNLIPYTKEREALLKSICDAFTSIDKKMCDLLKGSPEQIAKRLDAVQGPLLLAAPPKKAKKS